MPRADISNGQIKRKPGRPPKVYPPGESAPPRDRSKKRREEPKKKIDNCTPAPNQQLSGSGSPSRQRGRGINKPKSRLRKRPRPQEVAEVESTSEDEFPNSFSEVVNMIIKKVQEAQKDIRNIEESFLNYKNANEETTILSLKFYAAVPKLLERVAAGETFNDALLTSVFGELFPLNGKKPEPTSEGKMAIEPPDAKPQARKGPRSKK